jgi:hypothetical protein
MPEQNADRREAAIPRRRVHTLKDGTKIELAQLGLTEVTQCKQQALHEYRQDQIKVVTGAKDAYLEAGISEAEFRADVKQAILDAQKLTYEDLPMREAHGPVIVNGKYQRETDGSIKMKVQKMPYVSWWAEQPEGMLYAVWLSARKCPGQEQIQIADVDKMFEDLLEDLEAASDIVGELTDTVLTDPNPAAPATASQPTGL